MQAFGFDTDRAFDYENGFYLTSHPKRISKLIAHFEIYRQITYLPGQVLECGVFKGASFIRWLTFRDMLEASYARRVIGLDVFGEFPEQDLPQDQAFAQRHDNVAGVGIPLQDLQAFLTQKGFNNFNLVAGDLNQTLPRLLEEEPELRLALLHIDVDVYQPSLRSLELLYDRVVPGGVIVFDDYATVEGETRAAEEFFAGKGITLEKLPYAHIPAYAVKPPF